MATIDTMIKMAMDRWQGAIKNFDANINALSDEQLEKQIAPGKNRGVYLLGHLIAVHDDMLTLLDMGEKQYPEYRALFLESPDNTATQIPSTQQLRTEWSKQCAYLNEKFATLSAEVWFEKHTAVSAEDFAKELHRNKLNIIITRTTHLTYHTGQVALLK